MSKIINKKKSGIDRRMDEMYEDLIRRLKVNPSGTCPIDSTLSILRLCECHTCGKCVPCRIGLKKAEQMLEKILNYEAEEGIIQDLQDTARNIALSADCVLGKKSAQMLLDSLEYFIEDYESHIFKNACVANHDDSIPCVENCPAHVDIPGYISLVNEGRYEDAVKVVRRDNPFVLSCAYVCEHPCENKCRRNIVDYSVNIRGMKKAAADKAGDVKISEPIDKTDKKVAIIGGGPSGVTAAYYLSLMGHDVTLFEQRDKLGGMLQYGIPNYRLPKDLLKKEIDTLLEYVMVKTNVSIGKDISIEELNKDYDAIYIAIGAHGDKKLGCEGEDQDYVIPAVKMLGDIGEGKIYDFTGKKVLIVGGGNVAMDAARSSIRCGAKNVTIVYRRRAADMTALREEVEGARSEGCEIMELMAPTRVSTTEKGLYVKPQIIGPISRGRPAPIDSGEDEFMIPCDIIIMAIGQDIICKPFEDYGFNVKRNAILCDEYQASNIDKFFVGGDCATGPSSAINAIAAGKIAAFNIDDYLGYDHKLVDDVVIDDPTLKDIIPTGRVEISERMVEDRIKDFDLIEKPLRDKEIKQESSRCLRCDHYGCANFKGGIVR